MAERIVIDPVTRIEGHAKITIHLDAAGNVGPRSPEASWLPQVEVAVGQSADVLVFRILERLSPAGVAVGERAPELLHLCVLGATPGQGRSTARTHPSSLFLNW